MPDDLKSLLNCYSSAVILNIATFHGLAPKGAKLKGPMVTSLAKILPVRERVLEKWASLSKSERALAEGILRRGGQASVRALREALVLEGFIDKKSQPALDP